MARRRVQQHQVIQPLVSTLNWDVKIEAVRSGDVIADNYKGLHRDDNGSLLNIVKQSYVPASNKMLMDTVKSLSDLTGLPVHGFTEFGGGASVLGYLKNENKVKIGDWDTDNYMVVGNSFDYSKGFFVGHVNEVLRCTNAFSRIKVQHSVRHNSQLETRIDDLKMYFAGYMKEQAELKETFESWMGINMTKDLKEMFVDNIFEVDRRPGVSVEISSRKQNMMNDLHSAIAREVNDMGNSLWSVFNGATYYTTHMKNSSQRVFGNVLGTLADINTKAFNTASKIKNMDLAVADLMN